MMIKEKKDKKIAQKIVKVLVFIVFLVYAISLLYILFWALINSFKDNKAFSANSFNFPSKWMFSNYITAFSGIKIKGSVPGMEIGFFEMIFNSVWFSVGGAFISNAVSLMTAYVISKYQFKARNFIYSMAIMIMLIPVVGSLPATMKLYNQMGIINTPLMLITFTGGFGFSFLILHGFFKNISWSYAEAAFIDGATNVGVFIKIMIPLAMPAFASLFIISLIGCWNDYLTPLMFLFDYPTLSVGLFKFQQSVSEYGNNTPVYFAGIIISMIPIIALFSVFSETIMRNTVAGGLKG